MIYTGKQGQSFYDVCLQTYGTLNKVFDLVRENNLPGIPEGDMAGRVFSFDETKVADPVLFSHVNQQNIIFTTNEQS